MQKMILLALFAANANAAIYKCEVDGVATYSQTPCAQDAETVQVNVTGRSATSPDVDVVEQCFNYLKRSMNWKDPESLRLQNHFKKWETDKSGARHILVLELNAKNGYGAYGGATYEQCFINHSGDALSTVQHYINN